MGEVQGTLITVLARSSGAGHHCHSEARTRGISRLVLRHVYLSLWRCSSSPVL